MKRLLFIVFTATFVSAFSAPVKDMFAAKNDCLSEDDIVFVEWLESTGEQYILLPKGKYMGIDIDLQAEDNVYSIYGYVGKWNGGSRADTINYYTNFERGIIVLGGTLDYIYSGIITSGFFNVSVFGKDVEINGTPFSLSYPWGNYFGNSEFALFGCYNTKTKLVNCKKCRIGHCAIYTYSGGSSILAYDLYPVRLGSEGFMLDLLTGELIGNEGIGRFIVGPDVE